MAADMILHIENSKKLTKKLLELTNEFSKFAGYKIKCTSYKNFTSERKMTFYNKKRVNSSRRYSTHKNIYT